MPWIVDRGMMESSALESLIHRLLESNRSCPPRGWLGAGVGVDIFGREFQDNDFPRYTIIFQDLEDSELLIFQDAPRFQQMIFRTVLRCHHSSNIIQTVIKRSQK